MQIASVVLPRTRRHLWLQIHGVVEPPFSVRVLVELGLVVGLLPSSIVLVIVGAWSLHPGCLAVRDVTRSVLFWGTW